MTSAEQQNKVKHLMKPRQAWNDKIISEVGYEASAGTENRYFYRIKKHKILIKVFIYFKCNIRIVP